MVAVVASFGVHSVFAAAGGNGSGNGGANGNGAGGSPPQFTVNTVATDVPANPSKAYPRATGTGALYFKATNQTGMTAQVVGLTAGAITPANCAVALDAAAVNAWIATGPQLPNKSTVVFTVPSALKMGVSAAKSCEGATITAPIAVTVQQVK